MVGNARGKFAILVVLESLICHSLELFQHQKQNLTNLNYVHGCFNKICLITSENNFF